MKGKNYLTTKESADFFRKLKNCYKEMRMSVKKNGVISVDQMQEAAGLLWELYETEKVIRIDDKLIDAVMKGTTDTDKIMLYFLCLANSMPDIPVELSVQLKYSGNYAEVYNAVLSSGSHANPMLLTGLYRAWQNEDASVAESMAQ